MSGVFFENYCTMHSEIVKFYSDTGLGWIENLLLMTIISNVIDLFKVIYIERMPGW